MKKALASALALTLIAGMTSVSFAAPLAADTDATDLQIGNQLYLADKDNEDVLAPFSGDLRVKPGASIYVELLPVDGAHITNKLVDKSKVTVDWNQGKELVESSAIVNKKVSEATGNLATSAPKYDLEKSYASEAALDEALSKVQVPDAEDETKLVALSAEELAAVKASYIAEQKTSYKYMAEIKLKSSFTAKENDLLGTVKAMKKNVSANNADVKSIELSAVVGYDRMDANNDVEVNNDTPVVTFEDMNEETELLFGSLASFTVSVRGQAPLYLGYSLKPISDLVDQNENANIEFISFEAKPSFNRIGTLRLYAEEDSFVYEMTENGLRKLDVEYDEESEAFTIQTRALGTYMVSDAELKYDRIDDGTSSSSSSSDASSSSSQGGNGGTSKPQNPNTGVGGMTGIAMGLAGLSLVAGTAARKSKKK